VEVEKIGQVVKSAERIGKSCEAIVAEVESTQICEAIEVVWERGEFVISKNERFEMGILPDEIGDVAEMLFPEIELAGGVERHGGNSSAVRRVCSQR
jgi:hypothetical protein